MARSVRYKAWESKIRRGRFYFHTLAGNSKTIAPSQVYETHREVLRACEQNWIAHAKALGVYGTHTVTTFLATHPVPYTKDSLKPIPKGPQLGTAKQGRALIKLAKAIKLHEAKPIGTMISKKRIRKFSDIELGANKMTTNSKTAKQRARKIVRKSTRAAAFDRETMGGMLKPIKDRYISPTMRKKLGA